MATTNAVASSHVLLLLLAVTLAAAVSVQGQATAPAPSQFPNQTTPEGEPRPGTRNLALAPSHSAGGQCTPAYISELGSCVDYRLGRAERRGLLPLYERERCCRKIQGKPSAARCLCAAFTRDPDVRNVADVAGYVNDVLLACEEAEIPGLADPTSTSG